MASTSPGNDDVMTWLRGELVSRGWSYAELAGKLRCSEAAVGRWATGRAKPHPGTLLRLRALFKRHRRLDALAAMAERKGIDLAGLTAQLEALPDKAKAVSDAPAET